MARARDSLELASLASSSPSSPSSASSEHLRDDPRASRESSNSRKLSFSEDQLKETIQTSRAGRSYSISSAFDFTSNIYPLSSTTTGYTALGNNTTTTYPTAGLNGGLEKHKTLTYLNGLSLVIGLIIGSGIFSSPAQVNTNVGSPGASLIVWLLAGLLAWTGAASFAELGGAIPLNGGAQAYLSKIFGEWAGFLFTWTSVCVLKPGSAAIVAIIFGEYLVHAIVGIEAKPMPWVTKAFALVALLLVIFLNCVSTKLGIRMADICLFLKFAALLGVTIIGIVVAATGFSSTASPNVAWRTHSWFDGTITNFSQWAVALYAGLWAFDGWDNVNYVAGEFINPARDIPRVIHTSLLAVIIAYLAANLSYFFVLPPAIINSSNTVAVALGQQVFGRVGALVLALAVSGSCFGALNAQAFTSGRLIYASAKEGFLPSLFGQIGTSRQTGSRSNPVASNFSRNRNRLLGLISDEAGMFFTPIYALLLYCGLSIAYLAVGEFSTLVTFYGVAGYTFYFFTVLGLIVLRVREPDLKRPYKTWITTPIIFCCVSLFLLSRAIFARPIQTLVVVTFVLVGLPVYFCGVRRRVPRRASNNNMTEKAVGWRAWKRWIRL